jgi:hypothetical protein
MFDFATNLINLAVSPKKLQAIFRPLTLSATEREIKNSARQFGVLSIQQTRFAVTHLPTSHIITHCLAGFYIYTVPANVFLTIVVILPKKPIFVFGLVSSTI